MLPLIGVIGASVAGGVVGGLAANAFSNSQSSIGSGPTVGGYTPFVAGRKTVGQLRGDSQSYWTSWWNKHRDTPVGDMARTGVPGVW